MITNKEHHKVIAQKMELRKYNEELKQYLIAEKNKGWVLKILLLLSIAINFIQFVK